MKVITEKHVEKYLVRECDRLGYWAIKFPPVFIRGFPDRIILIPRSERQPAKVAFVEVKRPNEVPRLIQTKMLNKLKSFGFPVYVLDTYEAVDAFLLIE